MSSGRLYEFVYRGQLAEEGLDRAGRRHPTLDLFDGEIASKTSIELLDDGFVSAAQRMATVYTAIAAFENMVRDLVRSTLLDEKGASWVGRLRLVRRTSESGEAPGRGVEAPLSHTAR